ncbi:MAG: hypothetical protein ACTSQ8_07845 [Candidatus Helarchaeota archaeon]
MLKDVPHVDGCLINARKIEEMNDLIQDLIKRIKILEKELGIVDDN